MKRLITLFLLLCATSLFAQAPEKFSYQAVVRNTNNSLVTNAQVGVRVSILQGDADGEAIYVETHSAVTNANGLLTVVVGGGKTEQGEFAGIDWANGLYFLKTETDPNGGGNYSITSVQQLLSVPYALYSKEAGNGFSGDYNDLKNKPTIPQNVGELTNDAGYITLSDISAASKGGEANDAGIVQTTACGEIDLCEMANQIAQLQEMRTVLLPNVTTNAVTYVPGRTTATCGGAVTARGYDAVTGRGVCWGTEPNPTVSDSHTYDGYGTGEFASTLSDLQPNTTYYVRAYAINSVGTAYGNEMSFTTANACATITLPYSEDFESYTTATTGVQPECWVLEQEDVAITDATYPQLYFMSSYAHSGNYTLRLINRGVYAMPALSEDVQLNLVKLEMYLRQPNAAYRLEVGVWEDNGTFVPVALFNNSTTGVTRVECDFSGYTGSGRRIAFRNTLGNGKTWDYSYNYIDDITLDTVLNGNTTAMLPAVTTGAISSIMKTTAISGGEVTTDGDAAVTERGVCWATEPNPTVEGNHTNDGTGMGTFTSSLTGLTSGTTYYVRAYATNSVGTAYGEEVSFTTIASPQDTCATISLPFSEDFESYTTSTTANTGVQPDCWVLMQEDVPMSDGTRPQIYNESSYAHSGNYTLRLINRGIYAMPALSESVDLRQVKLEMYLRQANTRYELQVGIWEEDGTFVPVTTFNNSTTNVEHVICDFSGYTGGGRRIAFHNVLGGTANYAYSYNYIDDITLSTIFVVDEKSCPGTPTVTDIDGNTYGTVQIGEQCWMRENLRTTHYADGTAVPAGGDNTNYTETELYYYDYSSHSLPLRTRGYLYNWPAARHCASSSSANQGICPSGWHLPSDAEWTQLTDYVGSVSEYQCGGSSSNIAKALASTEGWNSTANSCAVGNDPTSNNASGFSVFPAGFWDDGEGFGVIINSAGDHAGFWSSTENGSGNVFSRLLYYANAGVYRAYARKYYEFSVRCLRDSISSGGVVVDEKSCPGTPTVTDIDGNTYGTVQIGEQCWMRENLRTTHYADGTAIPAGGGNYSNTNPYYYDYISHYLPLEIRGYLYNWPAAMEACPTGWHLPNDAEWSQLTNYVGSQSEYTCGGSSINIAKALAYTEGWVSCGYECSPGNQSETANNATGFSAVPAGYCYGSSFHYAGYTAEFISASDYGAFSIASACNEDAFSGDVLEGFPDRSYGFPVRCLRD